MGCEPRGRENARRFEEEALKYGSMAVSFDKPVLKHILVCGWRKRWTDDGTRFRKRLEDLTEGLMKGSTVTFLNALPEETFAGVMAKCEYKSYESVPQRIIG